MHETDAAPERSADAPLEVRRLFDQDRGCSVFSQRVVSLDAGAAVDRHEEASDEVVYVLSGRGRATIAGADHPLVPGTALFVAGGTGWSCAADDELVLLSVLVHDPEPASAAHAVVALASDATHGATAGRQFSLGATPEFGCASVTQFVGFIPPGRAPNHFHKYDEVIYVLDGEGFLEIDGEQAPLRPGTCVHLPARLVHCLANTGEATMHVLGVFRPAGSPAEAYYPDGTAAVVPDQS